MADILVKCAHCAQVLAAEAEDAGKQIACPKCNHQIVVAGQGIRFTCRSCKQEILAAYSLAGTDCECPGCENTLSIPLRTTMGMPSHESREKDPDHSLRLVFILGGILLLGAVGAWAIGSKMGWFGKGPLRAHPQATETVANNTNAIRVDFFASRSESERFGLWSDYEKAVRTAAFVQAVTILRTIQKTCSTPEEERVFWPKVIPEGRMGYLDLYVVCGDCSTGACVRCQGNGLCPGCGGQGVCSTCKGVIPEKKVCTRCVCAKCGGAGKCAGCRGKGQRACSNCDGTGNQTREISKACPSCGGSGTKPGLRRADGSADALRCVRCLGKGTVRVPTRESCRVCGGEGTLRCHTCEGSGRCDGCSGSGRQAGCSVCGGTGTWMPRCDKCNGNGKCQICQGTSKCPDCDGAGLCRECKGHGAKEECCLVADNTWLKARAGYIAYAEPGSGSPITGNDTGLVRVVVGSKTVNIMIEAKHVACISGEPSFEWCKRYVLK